MFTLLKSRAGRFVLGGLLCLGVNGNALGELVEETDERAPNSVSSADYPRTPLNWAVDLQFSPRKYERYLFDDTLTSNRAGQAFQVSIEWLPITEYGKFGVGLGLGGFLLQDVEITTDVFATLYAFPVEAFVSYRADFFHNQIIVPYGRVGPSYTFVKQGSRTGAEKSGFQNYMGLEFAVGGELLLDIFEPSAAKALEQSTGINHVFIAVEYLVSQALNSAGSQPNLARNEFRAGLRFEF